MSYTEKIPINLDGAAGTPAKNIDLNSATVQANWCPITPCTVTMCALAILNDVAATGVVLFKRRPTAGSATGEVTIATLNLTTAHTQGKVVYSNGLDVDLSPGDEVVVEVTDVTGAGDLAKAMMWVQYDYENPTNEADMVATA